MKRKLLSLVALCMALITVFATVGCVKEAKAEPAAFVSVDINPSIELTLDSDGKVLSVRGTDEDGQVLLYGEASLVGVDVEKAVQKITELAKELGYLNEDNKVVETSVSAKTEKLASDIRNKVNTKITEVASDLGVTIDEEVAYSLKRKYDAFIAEHSEYAQLAIQDFRLALSASEAGEISLEAALKLDKEEIIKHISESHKKLESYATDEYLKAKADAEAAFSEAEGKIIDALYIASDGIKGAQYNAYMTAARIINGLADAIAYAQDVAEYPLDESAVSGIVDVLNLENADPLKNSDGQVTVESIYAYLDKYFKNLDAQSNAEEIKEQINGYLVYIESTVNAAITAAVTEYADEVQSVLGAISIPGVDLTDGVTVDELKNIAAYLKENAQNLLKEIEDDLTVEQKKFIDGIKNMSKNEELKGYHDTMKSSLEQAKTQAQARLSQIKENRRASN